MDIFCQSHKNSILIDCTGKINPESAKNAGLIFKGIGRGNYNQN